MTKSIISQFLRLTCPTSVRQPPGSLTLERVHHKKWAKAGPLHRRRVKHRCLLETETSWAPDHLCPDCGVLLQTCRPADSASCTRLSLPSPRPLPVCPRAPGMPPDETWSLPSCWPQAEAVSPKNRRTPLYLKLHIDSCMLFSSRDSLHKKFMLDPSIDRSVRRSG